MSYAVELLQVRDGTVVLNMTPGPLMIPEEYADHFQHMSDTNGLFPFILMKVISKKKRKDRMIMFEVMEQTCLPLGPKEPEKTEEEKK